MPGRTLKIILASTEAALTVTYSHIMWTRDASATTVTISLMVVLFLLVALFWTAHIPNNPPQSRPPAFVSIPTQAKELLLMALWAISLILGYGTSRISGVSPMLFIWIPLLLLWCGLVGTASTLEE